MSEFEAYKKQYESIISLWEDTKEILGNKLGALLEELKLQGLQLISSSGIDTLLMLIPSYLVDNAKDALGFGCNASIQAQKTMDNNKNILNSMNEFSNKLFYDVLSGNISQPNLQEALSLAETALTKEPKKIQAARDLFSSLSAQMGSSIINNKDKIMDSLQIEDLIQDPKFHLQRAANLFNEFKEADFKLLQKSSNAAIKLLESLKNINNMKLDSAVGALHWYSDLKDHIDQLNNVLKLSNIGHIGKHIEKNIPNKENYLQDIASCMNWEMPDVSNYSVGIRNTLRIVSDLIRGVSENNDELSNKVVNLRNMVSQESDKINNQFNQFTIESMKKYKSDFLQKVENLASDMNADRLSNSIKQGSVGDIANMNTLTSTFEGYMCDKMRQIRYSINELPSTVVQAIDLVYTEFLAEHNVKMISGARYADNIGKLEEAIKETRLYIAEMEKLWEVVKNASKS